MKLKNLLAVLLLFPSLGYSQGLGIAVDSTSITFPNKVEIRLDRAVRNGKTNFQLNQQAIKTMVATTNYYLQRESLLAANQHRLMKSLELSDSVQNILEHKVEVEQERSKLFQKSYEDLKLVSASYDEQLRRCADDLAKLNASYKRAQRVGIVKGVGISVGVMTLIVLGTSVF